MTLFQLRKKEKRKKRREEKRRAETRRGEEGVYGHGYLKQLAAYCLQRNADRDIRKFRRRVKIRHEKEKPTSR